MTKRILWAGIIGGVLMFMWEGLAHEVLPLGEVGVKAAPNEAALQAAVKDNIKETGFYYFPAPQETPGMTGQQKQDAMQKAMDKAKTSPTGILITYPQGKEVAMGKFLGMQCAFDIAAMLIVATLLSWAAVTLKSFPARLLFVVLIGLIPSLGVDFPQWNWYGFPTDYTMAQLLVHVVGFGVGGLVLAAIVKR
jgi:hypothetical protein